jgi:hypothetical protein
VTSDAVWVSDTISRTGSSAKDRWVLGDGEAGLQRVRPVVRPDGEQLPGGRGRRAEVGRVEAVCADELGPIGPAAELGPLRVDRLRVGREPAVADLPDIDCAAVGHDDEAARQIRDAHGVLSIPVEGWMSGPADHQRVLGFGRVARSSPSK